jgi:7-keto-8-aminopelargonate synthetase-like enzyme
VAIVEGEEGGQRCRVLWERVAEFERGRRGEVIEGRVEEGATGRVNPGGAIRPVIVGGESEAMAVAAALLALGLYVPAVRYPTVPRGAARLRITLTAAHSAGQVGQLLEALEAVGLT